MRRSFGKADNSKTDMSVSCMQSEGQMRVGANRKRNNHVLARSIYLNRVHERASVRIERSVMMLACPRCK